MNVKEKAKRFAINAHNGQVRKSEIDKPLVFHSIEVAKILEEYGLDDNVIAAGYLHDVVEDTKYNMEFIVEKFGIDIAKLVNDATEPDKSLSWEERKMHTIEIAKTLPLPSKLLICADKISNLESLLIKFNKTGKRDFSCFKRGEEKQKWYYTSIYESLIFNEDENHPMFKRLKNVIDILFYNKEDTFIKDVIFANDIKYYEQLVKFHAQKEEIKRIMNLVKMDKPFVIEFSGTPRTGKTSLIKNLEDFFKKGGFKVKVIEEFTTSKYYKEVFKPNNKNLSIWEYNVAIIEEVNKQLQEAISLDYKIILIDRSLNDRLVWNYRRYFKGDVSFEKYLEVNRKYIKISQDSIDFLIVTFADAIETLKRDYENSLALEKRRFLNYSNIYEYNEILLKMRSMFSENVNNYTFMQTTCMSKREVTIKATEQILKAIRDKYLEAFMTDINSYVGKFIK